MPRNAPDVTYRPPRSKSGSVKENEMVTAQQTQMLKKVCNAIVETVKEMGKQGAPAGPLYAALMTTGMTLENFEQIMSGLVAAKMLRKSGQLYYYVGGAQ
jgi:hypothetical protein